MKLGICVFSPFLPLSHRIASPVVPASAFCVMFVSLRRSLFEHSPSLFTPDKVRRHCSRGGMLRCACMYFYFRGICLHFPNTCASHELVIALPQPAPQLFKDWSRPGFHFLYEKMIRCVRRSSGQRK